MANVMEVYKSLPQTNCKKCGEESCMSFAMKLLKRETELSRCTPLSEEGFRENKAKLEKMVSGLGKAEETGLVVDFEKCNGCGNCVVVCPVTCAHDTCGGKDPSSDDVVYKVVDGKVRIVNLKKCRRTGEDRRCTLCKDACPFGAIDFV